MTAADARTIAQTDLVDVERLLEVAARRDIQGAETMTLPRAADVVGMGDHHRENCRKLGLAFG